MQIINSVSDKMASCRNNINQYFVNNLRRQDVRLHRMYSTKVPVQLVPPFFGLTTSILSFTLNTLCKLYVPGTQVDVHGLSTHALHSQSMGLIDSFKDFPNFQYVIEYIKTFSFYLNYDICPYLPFRETRFSEAFSND